MNDTDIGQAVRDVIADLERKQIALGGLVENLRIVFPLAAAPSVDVIASAPHRLLLPGKLRLYRQPGQQCVREKGNLGHPDPDVVPRVVAQLRVGAGSVQEIAKALRAGKREVRKALYHLAGEGRAIVHGRSRGSRWSLKGASAVTPSPHQALADRIVRNALQKKTLADAVQKQPSPDNSTLARDNAILERLNRGPSHFAELRDAMPKEPGLSDEQRTRACANALTRLRLKKQIKQTEDRWALA